MRQALLDALAGGTAAPGRCLSMRQSLKMPEYADEDLSGLSREELLVRDAAPGAQEATCFKPWHVSAA